MWRGWRVLRRRWRERLRRCVIGWRRAVPLLLIVACMMTPAGCCLSSSTPEPPVPVLPTLTSLQRLTHQGREGVWMDGRDAGQLARWIYDVSGAGL